MRTRVQRWGNSLAVRIPKAVARDARLEENTPVDLTLVDGKVLLIPVVESAPTLEQLLAGVTAHNLHGEFDTGPAVGRETW